MKILLITFVTFLLVILGMAVGVIIANKRLAGSCGGLGKILGKDCEFCDEKDKCKIE